MAIGLSEAAAATGVNRSTLYRAWKAGPGFRSQVQRG
jgi:DNA-binding phage protein